MIGCSGWQFKDWQYRRNRPGGIYPKGVSMSKFLETYARLFDAVEIKQTSRGVISDRIVNEWIRDTPKTFRFSTIMWKRITHTERLHQVDDLLKQWITPLLALKERLGVILIIIPSTIKVNQIERFEHFLAKLPKKQRYAVEFRDPSWQTGKTLKALKDYNIAWASVYYPNEIQFLRFTGDLTYIRFRGTPKTYTRFNQLQGDPLPVFEKMVEQLRAATQRSTTYVFIDNQLAGNAPQSVALLKRILQLPKAPENSINERMVVATQ